LKKTVNKNREGAKAVGPGRVAQRNRTRKAIVDAAIQLIGIGGSPSVSEIAEAAQVSRRTVYMHFPTLEQLLADATAGLLSQNSIEPLLADAKSVDPVERVVQVSRAVNANAADMMHLGRALIRLTVEGKEPAAGGPRRGYRRVQWIERALAPARDKMPPPEFERLVSAICVLIGWEPLIVLQDIRGLSIKQADDVLSYAVGAVVEKALHDAHVRKSPHSKN